MTITHSTDAINKKEWSDLALASPFSSAFQTPEGHSLYASCDEFSPFFTAVIGDDNHLKGVVSGAVHHNGPFPFSLLTRRAIVFGGPLLAPDITDDELFELLNATTLFLRCKAIYLEYRFTEDYTRFNNVFRRAGITVIPVLDAIIDTSSHEVICKNIQKRKRRQVRAALRNDIEIVDTPTKEEIAAFYPRLRRLHWKASFKPIPTLDYFLKLADSPIGVISILKHNGKPIAFNASIVLSERKLYHIYSIGEDKRNKELAPSSVALYTLLHSAADHHIPICDLLGAGIPSKPYGVRDFKIRMGATILDYQRARKLFCPLVFHVASLLFHKYE